MGNSEDRYAQLAMDIYCETGWVLHPSEVRDNEEYRVKLQVSAWLESGRTEQFDSLL